MKAIYNCRIVSKDEIVENLAVVFDDKIVAVIPESRMNDYKLDGMIDGGGNYLAPGFIDTHMHGCSGGDVMDATESTLVNMSRSITRTGVTGFLATTMTMDMSHITDALFNIRECMNKTDGAEMLGCHLEGPFISREFKGAQEEQHIIPPSLSLIDQFKDILKIVTLAPESKGGMELIRECKKLGIVASIGHSNATYEEAVEAIKAGVTHITHTFNGMQPLHHRKPGVLGAAMLFDVDCELIVDNIHSCPAAQAILLKIKGYDRLVLMTDAMRACLMEEGAYDLGGQKVIVKNKEARLASGALAGSVLTMNVAIRNFIQNHGTSMPDAIRMASWNPARILSLEHKKGSIEAGKDADMVLFGEDIEIFETIVKGKTVYKKAD